MNKINLLNSWFIFPCLVFLFLFLSIFLQTVFTSSYDTTFTFLREVVITYGTVPSSHLSPQTSGSRNRHRRIPRCITGHLEWENIHCPCLCVVRTCSHLCNIWITCHIEWEHILRPGLCVVRPSSFLCDIYPQIYHFLLGHFSILRVTFHPRQGNS